MSVIQTLQDKYIVDFDLSNDKKSIEVMECCDYYYKTNLSKSDIEQLLVELFILYGQLED